MAGVLLFALCVAALGCGQTQATYWIRQLDEGDPDACMRAARALAELRSVRAVVPLARAAERAIAEAMKASRESGSIFFSEDVEVADVCYEAIVAIGRETALPELLRLMVEADANRDSEGFRAARWALEETIREEFPAPSERPECASASPYSLFSAVEVLRRDPAWDPVTRESAKEAYESILRCLVVADELDGVRWSRKRSVERVASLLGMGRRPGYREGISDPCARPRSARAPRLAWTTPPCGEELTEGGEPVAVALGGEKLVVAGFGYDEWFRGGYLVLAYSLDGSMLWSVWDEVRPIIYEGYENKATAVAIDPDGNVCVTGESWRSDSGVTYATQKYAPDGRLLWMAPSGDEPYLSARVRLAVDRTGCVCVSGSSESTDLFSLKAGRYLTIKYSPEGKELWRAYWTPPGREISEARAIAAGPDGAVFVTGSCWQRWGTGMDISTVKYSPEGKELWSAVYGGPGRGPDVPNAIAVDGDGSVYVAGVSWGGATDFDSVVIKYSADGRELWVARYDGPPMGWDAALAIALDPAGGVYVAGYSFRADTGDDYLTIQYSPDGEELWVARYDGPNAAEDEARYVVVDGKGDVYVGGQSSIADVGLEYCVVKYSPAGEELWVAPYRWWASPGVEAEKVRYGDLVGMAVDGRGGVYMVGSRSATTPAGCIVVVKYSEAP